MLPNLFRRNVGPHACVRRERLGVNQNDCVFSCYEMPKGPWPLGARREAIVGPALINNAGLTIASPELLISAVPTIASQHAPKIEKAPSS